MSHTHFLSNIYGCSELNYLHNSDELSKIVWNAAVAQKLKVIAASSGETDSLVFATATVAGTVKTFEGPHPVTLLLCLIALKDSTTLALDVHGAQEDIEQYFAPIYHKLVESVGGGVADELVIDRPLDPVDTTEKPEKGSGLLLPS